MNDPVEEARRWFAQATSDLDCARVNLRERFFAQACFQAQQAAEKALKALRYARGERIVVGHSVLQQLQRLLPAYPTLAVHAASASQLDQYYVPSRYPNGLPRALRARCLPSPNRDTPSISPTSS